MHGTQLSALGRRAIAVVAAAAALAGTAACASSRPAETPQATSGNGVRGEEGSDGPGDGRRRRGPDGRWNRLLEGIALSDAQRTSIDSIRAAYRLRMGDPRSRREASDAERAQWRRLMDEQRAAIRDVLTSEQQRKFDENAEAMRREIRERPRRGGPSVG